MPIKNATIQSQFKHKKYIFKKILESHTQKHCEKDNQSHIAQAEYVHDLIKFLLKIEIDFNFSVQ